MGYAMSDQKPYLKVVKPQTEAQKATRTTLDTILVTPALAKSWKLPSFQRELRVNEKVLALSREIAETQVIPGTLTLGVIDKVFYLVDGQHRREAFVLADIQEAFADVRYVHFEDEAEMGDEFVKLNSHLVNMRPDDILRGLEKSHTGLAKIRRNCPYVGYDFIRRSDKAPIVSMSTLLRCWFGSAPEVPSSGGLTARKVVDNLTNEEVETLIRFCDIAIKAWGKDIQHARLWGALNLTVCMWMFRRLTITPYSASIKKLTEDQFAKCLMTVAADETYHDWLLGRQLRERDRSPAYTRLKALFGKRLETDTGEKRRLPSPDWGGR